MSEVIENYIRRHPGLSEKDAFDGFLQEERIRSWVGSDDSRKERLRVEFGRTWGSMHVQASLEKGSARAGPSGPSQMQQARTVRVEVTPEAVGDAHVASGPGARKLSVLCTGCKHMDVWMQGETISCHRCGRAYDDMLQLIRVTPVGPGEFLFGEGWRGVATGVGIVGGLAALYVLLTRVL
ncbi:MAG TPA: hypothetical protein VM370_11955 [Candidatus Thermoplasmatota archaeon]|nr:hypothetical protein [Candidatus Thermoplasmatota archaeon]